VGALVKFESFFENLFDGTLTGFLRGQLQPVEIARRIGRVMESNQTVGIGHIFVPNDYTVSLCPRDFERLQNIRATVERELENFLEGTAREKEFSFVSRPVVVLEPDESLGQRHIRVRARLVDQPIQRKEQFFPGKDLPAPAPNPDDEFAPGQMYHTRRLRLDQLRQPSQGKGQPFAGSSQRATLVATSVHLAGTKLNIDRPVLTIGRGLDNDLVLDDQQVSRHHAELRQVGGKVCIRDLKSTNGTMVNGKRVVECVLGNGDNLSLGGLEFVFEVGD